MSELNQDEFLAALKGLEELHGHFTWSMPFGDLLGVVGMLQLALRHPVASSTPTGKRVKVMLDELIGVVAKSSPVVAAGLRAGFDPAHDVARN